MRISLHGCMDVFDKRPNSWQLGKVHTTDNTLHVNIKASTSIIIVIRTQKYGIQPFMHLFQKRLVVRYVVPAVHLG